MATGDGSRWARTSRPHRVAHDYAVVAGTDPDMLTELGPGAAALFEEVGTPRTTAEIESWLGNEHDVSSRLHAMIDELTQAEVLVAGGSPNIGRSSPVAIDAGSDARGIVLTYGLCHGDVVVIDDPNEAVHLSAWAERGRVVPLLARAVSDGAVVLPDSISRAVFERERTIQRTAVLLELELLAVADRLGEAGIDFVVLKGLATAHLDHPSPALRQTSDIDLLLESDDLAQAASILGERDVTATACSGVNSVSKATTVRRSSGIEVDLHARPVMLPYGAAALLPTVDFVIGDATLHALARPDRWAHAVAHYALSSGSYRRASSLRDVLATWPAPNEYVSWDDTIERWRAATLLRIVQHDLEQLDLSLRDEAWFANHLDAQPRWFERELVRQGVPGPLLHWAGPLAVLCWSERLQHVQKMTIERRTRRRTITRDESDRRLR